MRALKRKSAAMFAGVTTRAVVPKSCRFHLTGLQPGQRISVRLKGVQSDHHEVSAVKKQGSNAAAHGLQLPGHIERAGWFFERQDLRVEHQTLGMADKLAPTIAQMVA
jgi:hypothetical protein